jgi:glycerol-3-phosphate dehydrogenase
VTPDDTTVSAEEINSLIVDANYAFPALALSRADVTLVHRGVVPAVVSGTGVEFKPAPEILDHAAEGAKGAMTVVGVKYTTARGVAERVTGVVAHRLGRRVPPSRTAWTTLPGAGIADHEALAIETARELRLDVELPIIRHLIALYAERAADIIRLMHERPDLRTPVGQSVNTIAAEVVHVIRHEMAIRLPDIMIRRTGLGSAGAPPTDAVDACARIAAAELGWDPVRIAQEIAGVARAYAVAETPAP